MCLYAYKHAKGSQSHRLKQKIWKKHFLIKVSKCPNQSLRLQYAMPIKRKKILVTPLCLICQKTGKKKLSGKKTLHHNLTPTFLKWNFILL